MQVENDDSMQPVSLQLQMFCSSCSYTELGLYNVIHVLVLLLTCLSRCVVVVTSVVSYI